MSFLNDLLHPHKGSWGTPDFSITEKFSDFFGQPRSTSGGSALNDLIGNVYAQELSDPLNTNVSQPAGMSTILGADALTSTPTGTTTPTSTTPTGDDNLGYDPLGALEMARNLARTTAQQAYDRARGIWDEGKALLGQRKEEFKGLFDTSSNQILGASERERGNLQASNQGATERLGNSLRAMGLGGSAFIRGTGRQTQEAAKMAGQISSGKSAADTENLRGYNTNLDFANTQESALDRYLRDAANTRGNVESTTDINYLNDIGGVFNTLLANQAAINASTKGYEANPYQANLTSMLNSLGSQVPQFGNDVRTNNAATNLAPENLSYLEKLRQQVGGNLYA